MNSGDVKQVTIEEWREEIRDGEWRETYIELYVVGTLPSVLRGGGPPAVKSGHREGAEEAVRELIQKADPDQPSGELNDLSVVRYPPLPRSEDSYALKAEFGERVVELDFEWSESSKESSPAAPVQMERLCSHCEFPIKGDDYIEGTDGEEYCDIGCYNEAILK